MLEVVNRPAGEALDLVAVVDGACPSPDCRPCAPPDGGVLVPLGLAMPARYELWTRRCLHPF